MAAQQSAPDHAYSGGFHTTRWSLVLAAQGRSAAPRADSAESLETLCRLYWRPLFAFARRSGHSLHDAQDLTQEFFSRLLAKEWLMAVDQERGRFRSFLLMAMKRFLANEWDRSHTQKRGAKLHFISLHATSYAEDRAPELAFASAESPDAAYDRVWAVNVLDNAMSSLRGEYEAAGRLAEFEAMKPHLTAERGEIPYEELAVNLGISAVSARSALHRFRKRFREIFRTEIANTVADPEGIEDEMRAVVAALAREA